MTQEKPTSVRILTSIKRKKRSSILYAIGGFFAGVFVTVTLGLAYFFTQQNDNSLQVSQSSTVETKPSEQDKVATHESDAVLQAHQQESTDKVQAEDEAETLAEFLQPNEDELSKAFTRPTPPLAAAPSIKVAPQKPQIKTEKKQATAAQRPAEPQKQDTEQVIKAEPHVEVADESPVGSVQTTITRRAVETKTMTITTP